MLIHLKKWLLTVAIILASILGNPTVAVAVTVVGQSPLSINHLILNITNLTPQQEQQVQAVRQRRNREIKAVLNTSQQEKLAHYLHSGYDIDQALKKLDLEPEQKDLIKAIVRFTDLKMQSITSQFMGTPEPDQGLSAKFK